METTIKNHLNDLHISAARMLVLNSDNKMLISFFKDLNEKLLYLKQLVDYDSKYNWIEIENIIEDLKNKDLELTNVRINIQLKEITTEKKEAIISVKF
jgi:hypothetical protein